VKLLDGKVLVLGGDAGVIQPTAIAEVHPGRRHAAAGE
jgi:hypothetical protein